MPAPIAFRNVTRYVADLDAALPLYEGIGFRLARRMGDSMAILEIDGGPKVILHVASDFEVGGHGTALSFTMENVEEARAFVEKAGWRLVREPQAEDEGFFYIYRDLDGNALNLVGQKRR